MNILTDTLWVLGDSFCTEADLPKRWPLIIKEYFQIKYGAPSRIRYYNYAGGSMDTQTIIENWTKVLPLVKEGDAIVVCVSDISRARYPMKKECIYTLPFDPNPYNAPTISVNFNYAPVGWDPTLPEMDWAFKLLDIPFTSKENFKNYVRLDNTILSTSAHNNNKIELIEALYKLTPCDKKFIYTWTEQDILKSDFIYSKEWITENIFNNVWDTLHDDWERTNGLVGYESDRHLSERCEKLMAEYFIKEFEL